MTFADSVLHLVRAGARIDTSGGWEEADSRRPLLAVSTGLSTDNGATSEVSVMPPGVLDKAPNRGTEIAVEDGGTSQECEPGLADLEAAVGLVSAGLATRVILSGFHSWPGLLWRAYQLTDTTDVLILPTVVHPGGKVDIVVTRDIAPYG